MIPPLEDEIEDDEEEEGATEGMAQDMVECAAPTEDQETLSPAMGEGLPKILDIKVAGAAAEKCEAEKETTTIDRGTDIVVKSEGDAPPTGTIECQTADEQAPQDSAVSPSEGKDAGEFSPAKEENPPPPTDSPAVPPEAQQEAEEKAEAEELVAEERTAM